MHGSQERERLLLEELILFLGETISAIGGPIDVFPPSDVLVIF